jgi:predicted amidohydrolase
VEWGGARIGTMICYDWRFPESARTLALRGADVIAHPSNLVAAKSLWAPTMSTRSFENKVISITANRSGSDSLGEETLKFSGESQIVAMSGKILALASADGDEVVVAEADPAATRDKSFNPYNDLFGDRRPEFYT